MMSQLEREILDKFHQLDEAAQQRVRDVITQEAAAQPQTATDFDYDAWFRDVENLRESIRAGRGTQPPLDVVGILRGIRDGEDE